MLKNAHNWGYFKLKKCKKIRAILVSSNILIFFLSNFDDFSIGVQQRHSKYLKQIINISNSDIFSIFLKQTEINSTFAYL